MDRSEIASFLTASRAGYVAERMAAGDSEVAAARAADEQLALSFPNGDPAPGHQLFVIAHDTERVGTLWIGPSGVDEPDTWWIWDIAIDESSRGRGIGRTALMLAEDEARTAGASRLGLNVFGGNGVARHL